MWKIACTVIGVVMIGTGLAFSGEEGIPYRSWQMAVILIGTVPLVAGVFFMAQDWFDSQ